MTSLKPQPAPRPQDYSQSSPKIVDLRFTVNLLFSRFYIVLFVGKDRRKQQRSYPVSRWTRLANIVAAVILLLGLNVTITGSLFIAGYLVKSALGIDIFPHSHLRDFVP